MTTEYNDPNMKINRHDIAYKQNYGNFKVIDKNFIDPTRDDNDKNERMDDVDFDNIYKIEKEAQENETDQFDNINETDNDVTATSIILHPSEEQILSQKFTQLSTATTTTTTTTTNEQLTMPKDMKDELKKIPDFLTKRNQSFLQMLHRALSTIIIATSNKNHNNTNNINNKLEALRHIAILIYKIMFIQTYHILWTTYLKAGIGQLTIQSQDQSIYPTKMKIWPKQIKRMIQSTTTKMNKRNENEIYMAFVNNTLDQLDNQLKQYEIQLKIQANNFNNYTLTIQQIIEQYIEQNLSTVRMEITYQIELVQYDYHIQALKLAYYHHNPNEYQKQLMKQLCCGKYEQEITEQEFQLLQQQTNYYNSSSQSFECCSAISHSTLIDSIQNSDIRQQFYSQLKNCAEQAKSNILTLYMNTAKTQMDQCKKKYESDVKKMWTDRHSFLDNEKIPMIMIQLINHRCDKIGERIQCVYKYKSQSFLSTSNYNSK